MPTATTTEVQTATATGVALGILVVAPKSGEKGVALKVGEKTALYLTPLHAPVPQPYSEGSFSFHFWVGQIFRKSSFTKQKRKTEKVLLSILV